MKKGQSEIVFPILIGILVVFVLMVTQSISTQALSFSEAQSYAVLEQRAASDADFELFQPPTPLDSDGVVRNSGAIPLSNVEVTVASSGLDTTLVSPMLSQLENANFTADVEYGDLVIVSSTEGFRVFPVIPEPQRIEGATAEVAEAALLLVKTAVTTRSFIGGNETAELNNALLTQGGTNYTLSSNDITKGVEIQFDTNPCLTIGAVLDMRVLTDEAVTIRTFNGYEYVDGFICYFPPEACKTTDLSGVMQQDANGTFKILIGHPNEAPITIDYAALDLRCT
ncbi:MAG: hypothetical protein KAW41_00365 [Candidatus Diapherotrites archaeon]|nr:hypothetical protein [Candidatus Diapherotrites archaeon]